MTRLVPVLPGPPGSTVTYAVGLEQGALYTIVGPDGTRAAFNNRADIDHVGFLTAPPTGLDGADVRESADVIVEGDGGIHGDFFLGRRPLTMTGLIDPVPGPDDAVAGVAYTPGMVASRRINKLQRACRGLRSDVVLAWTPLLAPQVQIAARLQQPVRITGRMPKAFLIALVAADPHIYSQITKSVTAAASVVCHNDGNAESAPVVTLRGAWVNPLITNTVNGQAIAFTGLTMTGGDVLVIDFDSHTALLNGSNVYGKINFAASVWWALQPGDNTITCAGGAGTSLQVDFNDAWL